MSAKSAGMRSPPLTLASVTVGMARGVGSTVSGIRRLSGVTDAWDRMGSALRALHPTAAVAIDETVIFADALSPSLLIHLLKGWRGVQAE